MTGIGGSVKLRLILRQTDSGGMVLDVFGFCNQRVEVATSRLTFGNRHYFKCPCGRKCVKLYLPRGEDYFKCRACYRLTYASCNQTRNGYQVPRFWSKVAEFANEARKRALDAISNAAGAQ